VSLEGVPLPDCSVASYITSFHRVRAKQIHLLYERLPPPNLQRYLLRVIPFLEGGQSVQVVHIRLNDIKVTHINLKFF